MTESERKKILRKAKKAELKSSGAMSNTLAPSLSTDSSTPSKKVDEDPFGLKFMIDCDHISEAFKFLKPLLTVLPDDLGVIELACRFYFAKGKISI